MRDIIYTLCEGDYHRGVAALINSALRAGFDGKFVIGYRGDLPGWHELPEAKGLDISWRKIDTPMHFGYFKPQFGLQIAQESAWETLTYVDPDIVFLAPWSSIRRWIAPVGQVSLCADGNFPFVSDAHPWRVEWRALLGAASINVVAGSGAYPNSGFVAVSGSGEEFLSTWVKLTDVFMSKGGDTKTFAMGERWRAIVSDQDVCAAALMGWSGKVSFLGAEGMGFAGHFVFMSHAVEQPKPWRKCFTLEAVMGNPPTRQAQFYLRFLDGPIPVIPRFGRILRHCDMAAAKLVARFWRRG